MFNTNQMEHIKKKYLIFKVNAEKPKAYCQYTQQQEEDEEDDWLWKLKTEVLK